MTVYHFTCKVISCSMTTGIELIPSVLEDVFWRFPASDYSPEGSALLR